MERTIARDRELALVALWEAMGEIYGAKWLNQFGDSEGAAFNRWLQVLSGVTAAQIKNGFENMLRDRPKYLPDAMQFRDYCLDYRHHGLPSPRAAYQEACVKPKPKPAQKWSHIAVYLAGSATGWFELHSMTEDRMYPRFERLYSELCRRVMAGEDVSAPLPDALPEEISTPLTREQRIQRMEKLREDVKL